jgi:triacylglycerol lipase
MPAALHDLRTRSALAALAVALASGCGSITDPAAPAGARFATLTVTRTPVLFVHGWNSSAGAWTTMLGRFKADGWTSAELASFSYNTSQSNATTAA